MKTNRIRGMARRRVYAALAVTVLASRCAPRSNAIDARLIPVTVQQCTGRSLGSLVAVRDNGTPQVTRLTFRAAGAVCFRVDAGDGSPRSAPSAATAEVDGQIALVGPSDFNGTPWSRHLLMRGLTAGDHVLELTVVSRPGARLSIEVFDEDDIGGVRPDGRPIAGTVGAAGGFVGGFDDSIAALSVPPGALAAPIQLTGAAADPAILGRPVEDGQLQLVAAAHFGPDGTRFSSEITVFLALRSPLEPGAEPTPVSYDPVAQRWRRAVTAQGEPIPAVVTPDGEHVAFLASHFSDLGVALPVLPKLDLALAGTKNGVNHYCMFRDDPFSSWYGAPLQCLHPFQCGMIDDDYRRERYSKAFEQLLLRPQVNDGPTAAAVLNQTEAALVNSADAVVQGGGLAWDLGMNSRVFLQALRTRWGQTAAAGPRFKFTTFANVEKHFKYISNAMVVAGLAITLGDDVWRTVNLWSLNAGMQTARIESLRQYLAATGLDQDPSVKDAFEAAALQTQLRLEAEAGNLVSAMKALLTDGKVITQDLLVEAAPFLVPLALVRLLGTTGELSAAAARRLSLWVGLAVELWEGNDKLVEQDATLCALATLYQTGYQFADISVDGVGLTELKYAAYAEFAEGSVRKLEGDDLPLLHQVLDASVKAVFALAGNDPALKVVYWRGQADLANQGLAAIASIKYNEDEHLVDQQALPEPYTQASFACNSDPGITKTSCGSKYLGCYSGPLGRWIWTYAVAQADCTATFHVTATTTGRQTLYTDYAAFCDQIDSVVYAIEDDYQTRQVTVDQFAPGLVRRVSSLGEVHFTAGQTYTVRVLDLDPRGLRAVPDWCQAIGGAKLMNINIDTIRFEAPEVTTPNLLPSQRELIQLDGVSVLSFPFATDQWVDVPGSPFHKCSDATAKDLNTTLGPCDTEIAKGPFAIRAPMAGTIRFAGQSSFDPARGYQVLIESDAVPGFFVSMIHLQPFDPAVLLNRKVTAGEELPAVVGRSGLTADQCAHLHVVAWRQVLDTAARDRVLRGQTPESYTCPRSKYAALFELNPEWR